MAHTLDRLICDVHEDIIASVERIMIQLIQLKNEVPESFEPIEGLEVELFDLKTFSEEAMQMGQSLENAIKTRNEEITDLEDRVETFEDLLA